jgi:hypothetical protein
VAHGKPLSVSLNILDQETSKWRELEKDIRYYSKQITSLYSKLLVHEKPKLASVEVNGDQRSTTKST